MTELEVIDNTEVVPYRPSQATTLFGTEDPAEVIAKAAQSADALMKIVRDPKRGLISNISGKEYPKVEAWTLLGSMLGVFPVCIWSRPMIDADGWEARVEAHTRDGSVVGAAEAMCLRSERNWKNRDDFALRSMAQTRATAKALRLPLGFVMTLAGVEATPAEEMVADHPQEAAGATETAPQPSRAAQPARKGTGLTSESPQVKYIFALMGDLAEVGVASKDALVEYAKGEYGVEHITDLTGGRDGTASNLIERLQRRLVTHLYGELVLSDQDDVAQAILSANGADTVEGTGADQLAGAVKAMKEALKAVRA